MTELSVSTHLKGTGQVQIADEVFSVIAGMSALEVEGVAGMSGNIQGDIAEVFGVRNMSKGVKIEVHGTNVNISVNLLIKFGHKIPDVCKEVQKRIKNAIETMTGLNASEININVTGIHTEKK